MNARHCDKIPFDSTVLRNIVQILLLSAFLVGCASYGVTGNEAGSLPVSEREELEYKKAVTRCYKTGGSRVVKIMGQLRCY